MPDTPKRIAIVGSTGSIGRQALEIIAAEERFIACGLGAGGNWQLLAEQARSFRPEAVAIADPGAARALREAVPRSVAVLSGPESASELIRRVRPEMVLTAVAGSAGLAPTLAAIECGADLALANKESLVMAGAVVMAAARAAGISIVPVDSEHSAVFQCLAGHRRGDVRKVILTASGGPFRDWPAERIRQATLEEALNHPTWQMGQKVTIDSATLMNKALEVIEAHWLFDLSAEQIEVVIHPESLVHACVEFRDGSILAQMGAASMATPIAHALYYPQRRPSPAARLELTGLSGLHFSRVDPERFPAIRLGYEAIRRGGTAGAILNAADEAAVAAFAEGRIQLSRIPTIVEDVLNRTPVKAEVDLDSIHAAAAEARRLAEEIIARKPTRLRVTD